MPALLRPMAPTAPAAILCGDPARALAIAQRVLVEPKMSNHHRGLWGYHGSTPGGGELTVQATGIGGPSAAIVLSELARRGLRAAIRVGTARSLSTDGARVGSRLAILEAVAGDGASLAWGMKPGALLRPDRELSAQLLEATDGGVRLRSVDRPLGSGPQRPVAAEQVVDLQSAGLIAAATALDVRLAVGVVVSRDTAGPLEDDPLESATLALAMIAAEALAGPQEADGRAWDRRVRSFKL